MATGLTNYFDLDCTSSAFKIRVNWSETYDASTNSSIVTVSSVQFKSTSWVGYVYYPDGLIKVNGQTVITMDSGYGTHTCIASSQNSWASIMSGKQAASGSAVVVHDDDGSKQITIEVTGNRFNNCRFFTVDGSGGDGWGCLGASNIELTKIPTYSLSTVAGVGSTITVNRTASGYAGIGIIGPGTRLYYGDILKITFSYSTNYRLLTTTVNGATFISGNTHTVTEDVFVSSTAQVLASSVGATDADIGSVSTITVTKYNESYYHSLQYQFEGITGYITSSGGVQSDEDKVKVTSIPFKIPVEFYDQIPNTKTGVCTITCRTYNSVSSEEILGEATTCQFTITAAYDQCAPTVVASVADSNPVTTILTGDERILIRYKSTALCTMSVSSRNGASIQSMRINGHVVVGEQNGDVVIGTKSFVDTDCSSFVFSVTDSRGYTTQIVINVTVVAYVVLTCNPEITRPSPTGDTMVLTFRGNVYRGSFGAHTSKMQIQYRYKKDGEAYGDWKSIQPANIVFGSSTYRSAAPITLSESFDYNKAYEFQIRAIDGAVSGSTVYQLSSATASVKVQRGVPVFDWGENDFNVNVALMLKNVNILDIMYPIGSVYMNKENNLPLSISGIGEWINIAAGIDGVYAWERTS